MKILDVCLFNYRVIIFGVILFFGFRIVEHIVRLNKPKKAIVKMLEKINIIKNLAECFAKKK